MEQKKSKNIARITAGAYVLLLLLVVLLVAFDDPCPPPEQEGILINFGTTDFGSGAQDVEEIEEPVISEPTPTEVAESTPTDEPVVTQDIEETVAIEQTEQQETVSAEEVSPKEAEPEEEVVEEPEPEVNKNALFSGFNKNKNKSEGITEGQGNQGQEDGDPKSSNYQGENSGLGNQGFGHDLAGRSLVVMPKIKDDSQKFGRVNIKIKVDRNGNVSSATFTQLGSTTSDEYLIRKAVEAAMKAKFNPDSNAQNIQIGTMTFIFKPQ